MDRRHGRVCGLRLAHDSQHLLSRPEPYRGRPRRAGQAHQLDPDDVHGVPGHRPHTGW